jgi:hypothetical protein
MRRSNQMESSSFFYHDHTLAISFKPITQLPGTAPWMIFTGGARRWQTEG